MEPNATPNAGSPVPNAAPAAPSSASGPGSSGAGAGSGTANPTPAVTPSQTPAARPTPAQPQPGFSAANSPATQAATQAGQAAPTNIVPQAQPQFDFDGEFQRRYGVHPSQAQLLMQMGYRQYIGSQQTPQAAQPQQPAQHPWGIPQFDERLLQFVETDPATGQLRVLPGGPPDAAIQVQRYREATQAAMKRLLTDPAGALKDIVQPMAQQVAQQMLQQQMGHYQAHQQVAGIFQQNADWLFQRDQNGGVMRQFDVASGQHRPVLTPAGRFYAQQVADLDARGVKDPQVQHELAVARLKEALSAAAAQRAAAQQQGQQQGQAFVQQAAAGQAGNPNPTPTPSNVQQPQQIAASTLRDVMRQRLDAAGVTDDVIRNAR